MGLFKKGNINQNYAVLYFNYTSLKRDQSFRRRITHVIETSDKSLCPAIALVEYIGKFPNFVEPHGNSGTTHTEYVRTEPNVINEIKDRLKNNENPLNIYNEMVIDGKDVRDKRQIFNAASNMGSCKRGNIADQLQAAITANSCQKFIRFMSAENEKPPSLVLYQDYQIDILSKMFNCGGDNHVLGVDRTFNLGCMFATVTVFHLPGFRRKIYNHPCVIIGPILLHWDGEQSTYRSFFRHIKDKIGEIYSVKTTHSLHFGSDEEKALMGAIKDVFPDSQNILCTRHLKENFKRLCSNQGIQKKVEYKLMDEIFEKLPNTKDDGDYEMKEIEIETYVQSNSPTIKDQIKTLLAKIRKHVWLPTQNGISKADWTNNSCESLNHVIKVMVQWQAIGIKDLVEKLDKLCTVQRKDLTRAIYSEGNFVLMDKYKSMTMSKLEFTMNRTEEFRIRHFNKLISMMTGLKKESSKYVMSADQKLQITNSPAILKKPGQRRIRS